MKQIILFENADELESYVDMAEIVLTVSKGRVYHGGSLVGITKKAYQRLFLDIYP